MLNWIFGLLLLCAAHVASAQSLLISLFKTDYAQGEPVYPTLTITNNTAGQISVPPHFGPEFFGAKFKITRPDGKSSFFVPLVIRDDSTPMFSLGPGTARAESVALFFGRDGWVFDAPGSYQLTALMSVAVDGEHVKLESAPFNLTVTAAPAEFIDLLSNDASSKEAGKFLLWMGGDHLTDGLSLLNDLVALAPAPALDSHVNVAKGWNLSRPFSNYATNTTRSPNFTTALVFLRQANDADLPPRLRLQKAIAENICYRGLGKNAEATDALRLAYQLYRTYPELTKMGPQIAQLGPDPSGLSRIVFPEAE